MGPSQGFSGQIFSKSTIFILNEFFRYIMDIYAINRNFTTFGVIIYKSDEDFTILNFQIPIKIHYNLTLFIKIPKM